MDLLVFSQKLISLFKDIRIKKVETLLDGIVHHRTTQIWTIARNRTEYENFSFLLRATLNPAPYKY